MTEFLELLKIVFIYCSTLVNSEAVLCASWACFGVFVRVSYIKTPDDTILHIFREMFYLSILIYALHPIGIEFGLNNRLMCIISGLLGVIGFTRIAVFICTKIALQSWDFFVRVWDSIFVSITNKIGDFLFKHLGVPKNSLMLQNNRSEAKPSEKENTKANKIETDKEDK